MRFKLYIFFITAKFWGLALLLSSKLKSSTWLFISFLHLLLICAFLFQSKPADKIITVSALSNLDYEFDLTSSSTGVQSLLLPDFGVNNDSDFRYLELILSSPSNYSHPLSNEFMIAHDGWDSTGNYHELTILGVQLDERQHSHVGGLFDRTDVLVTLGFIQPIDDFFLPKHRNYFSSSVINLYTENKDSSFFSKAVIYAPLVMCIIQFLTLLMTFISLHRKWAEKVQLELQNEKLRLEIEILKEERNKGQPKIIIVSK